jgi:uncharacterized protein
MRKLLFLSIATFTFSTLFSQKIIGNWKGNIELGENKLPIIFHFYNDSSTKLTGKWESPLEKASNLPLGPINITGDIIKVIIPMISGSYDGKLISNDSISGTWHQNGQGFSLNLSRSSESFEIKKPAPLLPREKEISITSAAGSQLFGTLLSKNNQQPLAIIIAGSGPTDRDGNNPLGVNANSYKMLAYALDSQNMATFRYDKRGVAKSIPADFNENNLVFDDYIKDLGKIFDYVYDTLGFKNIYFVGHSEGSLIGMIAAQKKKVKGFVSIAGAGRPIDVVIEEQLQEQGAPDSLLQKTTTIMNELKSGREVNEMKIPQALAPLFRKSVQPYMISWIQYSPEKEIKKLNCPILILQGTCDIQIKETDAKNLNNANNKSTLDIIPDMTHTLKDAGEDCADQQKTYTDSALPINKRLVNDIVNFIKK